MSALTDADLDALLAKAEAATPGPWMWDGNKDGGGKYVNLTTVGRGVSTVMGFKRLGMSGAQPVFYDRTEDDRAGPWLNGTVRTAMDVAVPEKDYRGDIDHLDNADARWIAAADPSTVRSLIADLREASTERDTARAQLDVLRSLGKGKSLPVVGPCPCVDGLPDPCPKCHAPADGVCGVIGDAATLRSLLDGAP